MRLSNFIGFMVFYLMLVTWCVAIYIWLRTGSETLIRIAGFTGVVAWGVWRFWPCPDSTNQHIRHRRSH